VTARATIDASVALKWVLPGEADEAQALALRDEMTEHRRLRLFAPRLFAYEVVNGLLMAVRRVRMSRDDAFKGRAALLSAGIELIDPAMDTVSLLGETCSLTAYDASYVVVAGEYGGLLWTDDGPVYRALSNKAVRARVAAVLPQFELPKARRIADFEVGEPETGEGAP
jgi:predicted nucleic acid-binding protein